MESYLDKIKLNQEKIYTTHVAPENFDFHTHNGFQLTYIIGGTTYLIAEGKSYFIPTRHFVWIPPHISHKFVHRKKPALSVYNIYAPDLKNSTDKFFTEIGIYPAPNLLIEVLKTMKNSVIEIDTNEFTFLNSFFLLLPKLIENTFDFSLPITTTKPVTTIVEYVLNNLNQHLSLTTIAQRFNMSERTLSRLFQDQLQLSFLKYVKLARTIKAIELLLEGNLNITEIALEIGYKSITAFSNAFLEMTHKRPSDFFKENTKGETI